MTLPSGLEGCGQKTRTLQTSAMRSSKCARSTGLTGPSRRTTLISYQACCAVSPEHPSPRRKPPRGHGQGPFDGTGHPTKLLRHAAVCGLPRRVKATVYVRLKREVLDPQGDAIRRALGTLGFEGVRDVRVGKLVEIELDPGSADADKLRASLSKMAEELLANPVIEDFEVAVLPTGSAAK